MKAVRHCAALLISYGIVSSNIITKLETNVLLHRVRCRSGWQVCAFMPCATQQIQRWLKTQEIVVSVVILIQVPTRLTPGPNSNLAFFT